MQILFVFFNSINKLYKNAKYTQMDIFTRINGSMRHRMWMVHHPAFISSYNSIENFFFIQGISVIFFLNMIISPSHPTYLIL